MKTITVVLAAVVLSVGDASQEIRSSESDNVSADVKKSDGGPLGLNPAQMVYIQSIISKLYDEYREKNASNEKNLEIIDDSKIVEVDVVKEIDRSAKDESSADISGSLELGNNVDKKMFEGAERKHVLDFLSKLLNVKSKPNRRLDIEDNGDVLGDVIDIDDPNINDDHDEVVNFKANQKSMEHGENQDIKGRSGYVADSPSASMNMNLNHPYYRQMTMPRRGLFLNPGFFPYATPPTITYQKINNRDILQPMKLFQTPFRRAETAGRMVEPTLNLRSDANSYRYEPDAIEVETQNMPWGVRFT